MITHTFCIASSVRSASFSSQLLYSPPSSCYQPPGFPVQHILLFRKWQVSKASSGLELKMSFQYGRPLSSLCPGHASSTYDMGLTMGTWDFDGILMADSDRHYHVLCIVLCTNTLLVLNFGSRKEVVRTWILASRVMREIKEWKLRNAPGV